MRILDDFVYKRPSNLEAALILLNEYGDRARVIAGGTDLVVGMKYRSMLQLADPTKFSAAARAPRLLRPEVVISLSRLDGLKGVERREAVVRVGARATMTEIATSDAFPPGLMALVDAAAAMGSPLIRNRATYGGNLVHGRPAADTSVATIALGGRLDLARIRDRRWVKAVEFFTGPGETVKAAEELLVAIELPYGPGEGSAYLRQGTRRQLEIALAGAAAWVRLDPASGSVADARIGLGAVAPTPILAPSAAGALIGKTPGRASIAAAAAAARTDIRPIDDYRGSAAYRVEIVEVLVRRALEIAVARAGHEEART